MHNANIEAIARAIEGKAWVKIKYKGKGDHYIDIKPIRHGVTAWGDHAIYAWAWHGQKPGYYRFDYDAITEVKTSHHTDDPYEKECIYLEPQWFDETYDARPEYSEMSAETIRRYMSSL